MNKTTPCLFILVLQLAIATQYTCAQTNLNPPDELTQPFSSASEVFLPEFEAEANSQPPTSTNELKVVGHNQQGQPEYSVLENTPGQLVVESGLVEPILNQQELTEQQSQHPNLETVDQPQSESVAVSDELNQWLTGLILKHMPHEYLEDKKWGKQTKRWAGVNLRRDKQDSKSRYKMVNHGTWQKYAAKLIDPNNKFAVKLSDVSKTGDGKTAFDVGFVADLQIDARQAKWVKGVQLYSLSAKGKARIALAVSCEMGVGMDLSNFPPDLIFAPEITDAKISILNFKLDRVSKVGGEVAQQMGRHAKRELESRIHEKEKKLVQKLNKEITENKEKLRLSISEAVRLKWYKKTRDFLPDDVRKTLATNEPAELPNTLQNPNHTRRNAQRIAQQRARNTHNARHNQQRRSANRPSYYNQQRNVRRTTNQVRTNVNRRPTNPNQASQKSQSQRVPKLNLPPTQQRQ